MDVKLGVEAIRDENIPINLKVNKMLKLLGGRVYLQKVEPSLLIVHPDNRSGLMVNSHDVHEKGLLALKLGFEEKKLNESWFEMNACKATRDKAIASMQKLHENSDKRLAPLNGTERFMSVSSSHISFARQWHVGNV